MLTSQNIEDIYELTPMQEGIYFHHLLDVSSNSYFIQIDATLHGRINQKMVEDSFNMLVARHTILRTVFNHKKKDKILQVVLKSWSVDFSFEDISNLNSQKERERRVESVKQNDIDTPFDLTSGKLTRIKLLQTDLSSFRLLWSTHHILLDGWCMGILVKEFFEIYSHLGTGKVLNLPPAPPFGSYISWLNEHRHTNSNKFWKDYLSGYVEPATITWKLPGERTAKSLLQSSINIGKVESLALTRLAENLKVTVNVLLQCVWALVVGKFSGKDDVVFGGVVSGRPENLKDVEDIVGLFINTVPVRAAIDYTSNFSNFATDFYRQSVQCQAHAHFPLAEIQAGHPLKGQLIDHVFAFENFPVFRQGDPVEEHSDGIAVGEVEYFQFTNYDLSVLVVPGDEITITFKYNESMYSTEFINQMQLSMGNLIRQTVENPEMRLSEIDLLRSDQKDALVKACSGPVRNWGSFSVVQSFEKMVGEQPGKTAIVAGNASLDYRTLNKKANQLAHFLKLKHEVSVGDIVAIRFNRTLESIVSILAILKAGAAFLPLDPGTPEKRIDSILQDSKAKILLTDIETNHSQRNTETIRLGDGIFTSETGNTGDIPVTYQGHDAAYIIYTSGTTGSPKGVVISHASLVNHVFWHTDEFEVTERDTTIFFSSFSFDGGYSLMWSTLLVGGTLHLYVPATIDGGRLMEYLIDNCITRIYSTPSQFNLIVYDEGFQANALRLRLRLIILGAEHLQVDDVRHFLRYNPYVSFANHYGPTETTIGSSGIRLSNSDLFPKESGSPIGRPSANTQIYVLDRYGMLLPTGAAGELCIAGDGLAIKYLNAPTLTNEKFQKNPFGPGRIYRTGDLARWTFSGQIRLFGRLDNQLKLRGLRVEPGEIESVILQFPSIIRAVVALKTVNGHKVLAAYFVSDQNISPGTLRDFLVENLQHFMVPSFLFQVSRIPLLPSGKVDYRSLPEPSESIQVAEIDEPTSSTELKVLEIWKQIFNTSEIGVNHDFVDIGGHSVLAIRMMSRIQKETGCNLELREIFNLRSIKRIAKKIDNIQQVNRFDPINKTKAGEYFAISPSQKKIWITHSIAEDKGAYNIPIAINVSGSLDLNVLEQCFLTLIGRHEVLRTSFVIINSVLNQKIHPIDQVNFRLKRIELQDIVPKQEVDDLIAKETGGAFDLETPGQIRATVIKKCDNSFTLIITLHHIIADGWSTKIFLRELVHLYKGLMAGHENDLTPLRVQNKDCANWINEAIHGATGKADRQYWLSKMKNPPSPIELAPDFQRPTIKTFHGRTLEFSLDSTTTSQLRNFCKANDVSAYAFFHTLVTLLLYRYSGQSDVVVGMVSAGRYHPDMEDQLGCYTNTVPVRTPIDATATFLKTLEEIKESVFDAIQHQLYPIDHLIEELKLTQETSGSSLFDILIVYEGLDLSPAYSIDGLEITAVDLEDTISKFDLVFVFAETQDNVSFALNYNSDIFSGSRIERMAAHLKTLLNDATERPNAVITNLKYVPDDELHKVLVQFNNTERVDFQQRTVIDLFSENVSLYPQMPALIGKGRTLSYTELDAESDRLAFFLNSSRRIMNGDVVAILGDRSEKTIVSFLAILKCGAIYLPIDPAYPKERIQFILDDAKAKTLIIPGKDPFQELNTVDLNVIFLDEEILNVDAISNRIDQNQSPTDLAYLIYTSGSTGTPKGVGIEHQSLVNMGRDQIDLLKFSNSDRIVQFASISFDASIYEIVLALFSGGAIVLVEKEIIQDPKLFVKHLKETSVTMICMPPSYLHMLDLNELYFLKVIVTAGELPLREDALQCASITKYFNAYGPTECSVCVTNYRVDVQSDIGLNIPIGRPISNVQIYLLDQHMQPVGIGNIGEIYIGGVALARGYVKSEEADKRRFVQNPFRSGERLYRTGDLGKQHDDGNIVFMGRTDNQVKIRGFRIELKEIEEVILSHADVRDCAVIVFADESRKDVLTAYYVCSRPVTEVELRAYLQKYLPHYMIPAFFIEMEAIPQTVNRKLDKQRLPPPTERSNTYHRDGNQSQLEQELIEIWKKVLGLEHFQTTDNFFDVGGDSLKIIQLHRELELVFNKKLAVADLFVYNSISALGRFLGDGKSISANSVEV